MNRIPVRVPLALRGALLALFAAAGVAAPVSAQQPAAPASGQAVIGTVVDAASGRPLPYALVGLENTIIRVLTDSTGAFVLSGVPTGVHNITASQLGYSQMTLPVAVAAGAEPVEFKLFPDPIAIEGIRVMGDRFRGRRNSLAVAATGFERERLLMSPTANVMDFLEQEGRLVAAECPGRQPIRACFSRRGQVVQPQVFLDEAPLVGGLTQLAGYNPRDFALVEVIDQGMMIRAYTPMFMERLAKNPRALEPIIVR